MIGIIAGVLSGVLVWIVTELYHKYIERKKSFTEYLISYCKYILQICEELTIFQNSKENYDFVKRTISNEPGGVPTELSKNDEETYHRCSVLISQIKNYDEIYGKIPKEKVIDEWKHELATYYTKVIKFRMEK
jgi:hypothetical protein